MILIIYGTNETSVDAIRPRGIRCPNCKAENQMLVEKKAKFVHLMLIPLFPIKIIHSYTCKACNEAFHLSDMSGESKAHFKQFKSKKMIPFWLFSGPLLILIAVGWTGYNKIGKEDQMFERLNSKNQNQIIEYETVTSMYSTIKTCKITSDSVWFFYNNYETEHYSDINQITASKNYAADTTKIRKEALTTLLEQGEIKAIYVSE